MLAAAANAASAGCSCAGPSRGAWSQDEADSVRAIRALRIPGRRGTESAPSRKRVLSGRPGGVLCTRGHVCRRTCLHAW
jgi:hypothetical protein